MQAFASALHNPHTARLSRQPGCLAARRTWLVCLNVMLGLNFWLLGATLVFSEWGMAMALIMLVMVALPMAVLLPVVVAIMATGIAAEDVQSTHFEVLKTTTLSNWQLVGGYLAAVVRQLRTFFTTLLGLWLSIISTTFLAMVVFGAFETTPAFNTRFFLLVGTVGAEMVGISAVALILPIALAIRFGREIPLGFIMPFTAVALGVVALIISYLVLEPSLPAQDGVIAPIGGSSISYWDHYLVAYGLLGGWPYALAGLLLILALRWVRDA